MHRIPLTIELDADEPEFASLWVDATVAARPYRMLLDSGAARSRLPADEYTGALAVSGRDSSSVAFGTAADEVLVSVRDLVIGALRVPRLEVTRGAHGPALLGLDVLGRHRCRLRPGAGVLDLDGPDDGIVARELSVGRRGHPYIELRWPGVSARACWDTGASATVVDLAFWRRHPALFDELGVSSGEDAGGEQAETPLLRMAAPRIGGRMLRPHKVVAVDLSAMNSSVDICMDLILGYPTISQAEWFFDFPGRRWSVVDRP